MMNTFNRLFGAGPGGVLAGAALFMLFRYLRDMLDIPEIVTGLFLPRLVVFIVAAAISAVLIIWGFASLNPRVRGKVLIKEGALKYFRHPLYAAFLTFFNFGLAVLLNNWAFVSWAVILHAAGHLLVRGEERVLKETFPGEYEDYCNKTGRFIPRLIGS